MNKPFLIQALVNPAQKSGVGRYLDGYLKEWSKSIKDDFVCLEDAQSSQLGYKKIKVWLSGIEFFDKILYQVYNWYYQKNAHKLGFGGVFIPNLRFVFKSRVPLVITIHDMAEFDTDTYSGLQKVVRKWMVKRALKFASLIITVSEFTKERLLHHFNVESGKIRVIYPGIDGLDYSISDDVLAKELSKTPYYLYAGRFSKNKGFDDIIKLYQKYKDDLLPIFIIGPDSNEKRTYSALIQNLFLHDKIIMLPFVTDAVLNTYFSNCEKLIFPSRYEGFGFPVLEALNFGKEVVVCFNNATYEIAGDICKYYKAGDIDDLYNMVTQTDISNKEKFFRNKDVLSYTHSASELQKVLNKIFQSH